MENETNLGGTETTAGASASSDEIMPSEEEYITDFTAPMEEFGDAPRQADAETEDKTEGADDESSTADTDAAKLTDDQVEKTDEEKAVDEELKLLPESERFRALRKMVATNTKTIKELETERDAARTVMFNPTVPAEDFVAQGKAKEFWDDIAKNHSAYYTPMVQDMIRVELNTERLGSGAIPQPVADVLADVFAKSWLPHFLTEQYGIDLPTFQTILERSRSGETTAPSEVQPAKLSPQELTDLKLDPNDEADKLIIARIERGNQPAAKPVDPEIAQLRAQYNKLLEAQNGTVKQRDEAAMAERVNAFESLLSTDRQGLLDEHLKRIPRDSTGNILKGYEHLPQQIADRVELVLSKNQDYKAKRDHAVKWYRQPGSVEAAKHLASGDMKGIYAHHKATIAQIVAQELAPYADRINAVKALETERRTKQIITGGSSPTHEAEAALRPQVSRRPITLAERAKATV